MKKKYLLIGLAALALSGCKKWLDVKSKTDVVQSDLFTNEQGFMDATAGVYYTMASNATYGDKMTMGLLDVIACRYDIKSDLIGKNMAYGDPTYQTSGYLYTTTERGYVDNIWDTMYNAIANANNILANIDAKKQVFRANNYNLIKGELLGLRGFMHFDLLRMFGAPYLTSKDSLSIPYVKIFSGKLVTPLSTVKNITDSAIADLTLASQLLQNDNINSNSIATDNSWLDSRREHFNYWAVQATLARIYLYRGEKANALLYAKKVINSNLFPFVAPSATQGKYADVTFTPEHIFSLSDFNIKPLYLSYFSGGGGAYVLTNDYAGPFNPQGSNVELIYETSTVGSNDIRYKNLWQSIGGNGTCIKYAQNLSPISTNLVPIIRLPEMYYIAAECSAPPDAVRYLNTVREKRGIGQDLPPTIDPVSLQAEIFKEYQKEFYCEGQLFYYYKRLNAAYMVDYNNVAGVATPINVPTTGLLVFPVPQKETTLGGR